MTLKDRIYIFLFSLLLIIPISINAYSDYIVASGENVGIKIKSDGIIIVGTYKVDNQDLAQDAGLKVGDVIESINNTRVKDIDDMINIFNNSTSNSVNITFKRNNEKKNTSLKLVRNNNLVKTGLYVKDCITGIGTLTYVDPNTKIFGALGHEIADSNTNKIVKIQDGYIYPSEVVGIIKSTLGSPGEKNATFNYDKTDGNVNKNTIKGIFGNYTSDINKDKLYKVASYDDVKLGNAKIKTVLNKDIVDEFDINIISVTNNSEKVKNIIFEITDKDLLNKTNGIIQGMSGSPIIQGNNIVGAVTHVVIDNPLKGYGILITNMLEEGEK